MSTKRTFDFAVVGLIGRDSNEIGSACLGCVAVRPSTRLMGRSISMPLTIVFVVFAGHACVYLGKRALVAGGTAAPGDGVPPRDCWDYRREDLPPPNFQDRPHKPSPTGND